MEAHVVLVGGQATDGWVGEDGTRPRGLHPTSYPGAAWLMKRTIAPIVEVVGVLGANGGLEMVGSELLGEVSKTWETVKGCWCGAGGAPKICFCPTSNSGDTTPRSDQDSDKKGIGGQDEGGQEGRGRVGQSADLQKHHLERIQP